MHQHALAFDSPEDTSRVGHLTLDADTRRLVADLHVPRPAIFWTDVLLSAAVGWGAFAIAVVTDSFGIALGAVIVAAFALYRGMCFTHELTHLRRRAVPGLETAWNVLYGVPLLLPSFTYVGVHQSHHSLATYGTKDDPEYLPFAQSRRMIFLFAFQSAFILPILLAVRFLVLAPIGLLSPKFHRFLEAHASSFSMNPAYRRTVPSAQARQMRFWEVFMLAFWGGVAVAAFNGLIPLRLAVVWLAVMVIVSFVNTLRVLGAHEYESEGAPSDRRFQLLDSIDTPGGPWTELWAPVGLRYHALHHYFPGIPYHNLGIAYRRLAAGLGPDSVYFESTSPSLRVSLVSLYRSAKAHGRRMLGW